MCWCDGHSGDESFKGQQSSLASEVSWTYFVALLLCAGARAVAVAVAGKKSLWKLNLRENELEDRGAVIVSRAMMKVCVCARVCADSRPVERRKESGWGKSGWKLDFQGNMSLKARVKRRSLKTKTLHFSAMLSLWRV